MQPGVECYSKLRRSYRWSTGRQGARAHTVGCLPRHWASSYWRMHRKYILIPGLRYFAMLFSLSIYYIFTTSSSWCYSKLETFFYNFCSGGWLHSKNWTSRWSWRKRSRRSVRYGGRWTSAGRGLPTLHLAVRSLVRAPYAVETSPPSVPCQVPNADPVPNAPQQWSPLTPTFHFPSLLVSLLPLCVCAAFVVLIYSYIQGSSCGVI